jgi:Glycoside-hydrolase family GH114
VLEVTVAPGKRGRPFLSICFVSGCVLAILVLARGLSSPEAFGDRAAGAGITNLPHDAVADYQLGGAYAPAPGVTVVTRDSTAKPAPGLYSICYLNGFQSQPGVRWPTSLLLLDKHGKPLVDPGWPGEHLFDIGTAAKRERIAARLDRDVAGCAMHGFEAVEFDNLDSYTRSKGAITLQNAIAFATVLVRAAHQHGLAAAQKNTPQLGSRGRDQIGFDFAVAEECDRFDECPSYTKVYGDRVIDVEYTDDLRGSFSAVCGRSSTPADTMLRDHDLTPRGGEHYVYRH